MFDSVQLQHVLGVSDHRTAYVGEFSVEFGVVVPRDAQGFRPSAGK